ncbi:MAG: HlyD family efflux transporter periplasmic adaptor subunit [Mariniblastus sp.]|nr:HlyD family efflux transporter periplasmic adaptor subunit [Mariniblastus sp.]
MSTGESKQTYTAEDVKAEVRQTIAQLSELSRSNVSFDEFSQTVLTKIIKLTGGHAALLWQSSTANDSTVTHRAVRPDLEITGKNPSHEAVINQVIESKQPIAIASETLPNDTSPLGDSGAYLILVAPVYNRKKICCGALELLQRREISDSAQQGYLKFLSRITELFPRWHENQELSRLNQNAESMSSTLDFVTEIHRSIDIDETAFAIANEARRVLASDRVSIARWTGSKCKIIAVSSQDRFDNRANVIRKLADVATSSVSIETPFWVTGKTEGFAPKIANRINDYMDESHCRTLAVIPLLRQPEENPDQQFKPGGHPNPKKLGAMIIEFFDADVQQPSIAEPCKLVTEHAELALANATHHSDIILLPVWTRLGRLQKFLFRDHFTKTMTGIGVFFVIMMLLMFFPKELQMRVNGVMQPQLRKNLFAQTEGIIREVYIDHGSIVKQGDLLIVMENQDLDMQIAQEEFQLETIEEEIKMTNVLLARQTDLPLEDSISLGNKLTTLEKQKSSKERQLELMLKKRSLQKLYSPIDGTVVLWEARKRLEDLPVDANQYVLEIAALDGDWQLELDIPQNKIGYVSNALAKNPDHQLSTEFRVATNPNLPQEGELVRVADRAELSSTTGTPHFRAIVDANINDLSRLRPGSGVTARINCGKRSLGFVWFYQVIDFFRTQVFF